MTNVESLLPGRPSRECQPAGASAVHSSHGWLVWSLPPVALLTGLIAGLLLGGAWSITPADLLAHFPSLSMLLVASRAVTEAIPVAVLQELLIGAFLVGGLEVTRRLHQSQHRRQKRTKEPSLAWRRAYFCSQKGTVTQETIEHFLDANPSFRERLPLPALRAIPPIGTGGGLPPLDFARFSKEKETHADRIPGPYPATFAM